jgi:hypothetical protein
MKKCPYCAEEIQSEAVKCKHCSEFLNENMSSQIELAWYFKTYFIVSVVGFIGPLGLPLVLWHPKYSLNKKIIVTSIILCMTWLLYALVSSAMTQIDELYKTMDQLQAL